VRLAAGRKEKEMPADPDGMEWLFSFVHRSALDRQIACGE
jgi:hypothetical protein